MQEKPQPSQTECARFLSLFTSNEAAHTLGTPCPTPPPGEKAKWRYTTIRRSFDLLEVRNHLVASRSIVAIPIRRDSTCTWAAIDVDVYVGLDFAVLALRVYEIDAPLYVFKSKSGGFHLFAFFPQPRPASLVRRLLKRWAADLGFASAEVFPKQDQLDHTVTCGNGINLPFFGDAADFAAFRPELYCVPPDEWELAPDASHPEAVPNDEGQEAGYWDSDALAALLKAWAEAIPGFHFRCCSLGFSVPCPGNLPGGWPDGARHTEEEPMLSLVMQVWVKNGWPVFKCFHAHCDGGCGQAKKTWKDFREYYDPLRLFFNFDDWQEAELAVIQRRHLSGGAKCLR